jgi:hypothetical protein
MPINFNINPYYDDYDADKGFLRVLFRPGYAVQARELTQLQTILQNQIGEFGAGIYKNGSIVYGANSTVDEKAQYIVLESEYDNAEVTDTLAGLVGKTIVTQNNPIIPLDGFVASRYSVLGYQAATDDDIHLDRCYAYSDSLRVNIIQLRYRHYLKASLRNRRFLEDDLRCIWDTFWALGQNPLLFISVAHVDLSS